MLLACCLYKDFVSVFKFLCYWILFLNLVSLELAVLLQSSSHKMQKFPKGKSTQTHGFCKSLVVLQ